MIYNPHTQELFANNGTLIKQVYCPLKRQWADLARTDHLNGRLCETCTNVVLDTALFDDNELLELAKTNPHTCLKLDFNQPNLTITYHTNEELQRQPKRFKGY